MMKKFFTLMSALFMFVSCQGNAQSNINHQSKPMEKKVLVAYFSYSGTTKRYAEKIADVVGNNAVLFQIQATKPYTAADVDWTNDSSRVNKEMKTHPESRPQMTQKVENIQEYDVVFIGFPIWWYIAPNIIKTFLETHDLRGKTIVPFFTSTSSGPGETDKHLHLSISYSVTWKPAVRANGLSDTALKQWIEESLR